jgi:phenylpyruvate tautomerase PptA (4-oxalocrotonate tautomerase family)
MLLVNAKVARDALSDTQKCRTVEGLTETLVAIAGEGVRRETLVLVEEIDGT